MKFRGVFRLANGVARKTTSREENVKPGDVYRDVISLNAGQIHSMG